MTVVVNVKTGVSIREDLASEADALAKELRVSRSQLYSMALDEFVRKHENKVLLERLNASYGEGLDPEEDELLRNAKRHGFRILQEDER